MNRMIAKSKRDKNASTYRRIVAGNVNGKSTVKSDEQIEPNRFKTVPGMSTFSTALISRRVVRGCLISSRAFRQRSSTNRERSWLRETS
jgi:hypothetical protein